DVDGSGTPVALVLGTATALTATDGSSIGDLTLNTDGSYSFDPAPDFNGTVPTVNYTVTDPEGNTDSTTLDITVDPVNDVVANPETESTDEDVTLTGTVITNDTDEDGDTLTVDSATVDVDGSGTPVALVLGTATALTATDGSSIGDLTLNADGSYSFDPAPNFNGTVPQVGYTVTDAEGNTDSTTLDITVTPVEDVPVASPEIEITPEDVTLTGNVLTNDTDGDGNNTLTVDSATVDVDGSGTPVALVLGTATALTATDGSSIGDLTLNTDGSYSFDPAPNFNGTVPQVI
ncbi:tandem-95 repeat protein, partial [Psychrobacter fozii]|uniref:tandem-95 repeat protein n=1 Tax=Psychrobacter fozii TaxID=198480 RepID=UPI0019193CC9